MGGKAIDHFFEVLDVAHVSGHDVAIVAVDASAVDDFRGVASEVGNRLQLAGSRPNADHGGQRVAECSGIEVCVIAEDHAVTLQALESLGDGGRR